MQPALGGIRSFCNRHISCKFTLNVGWFSVISSCLLFFSGSTVDSLKAELLVTVTYVLVYFHSWLSFDVENPVQRVNRPNVWETRHFCGYKITVYNRPGNACKLLTVFLYPQKYRISRWSITALEGMLVSCEVLPKTFSRAFREEVSTLRMQLQPEICPFSVLGLWGK